MSITNTGCCMGNIYDVCEDSPTGPTGNTGSTGSTGPTGNTGPTGGNYIIQTTSNFVSYNYMKVTSSIPLTSSYTSPGGVITNTVPAFPGVSQLSNTLILYTPPPRQSNPVTIPFLTASSLGTTVNSSITLSPSLTAAYDTLNNYFLACDTVGQLYQIKLASFTEIIMKNYDGTTVSPFVGLIAMAQNINDNVLYYVLSSSPTTVNYYLWGSKGSGNFITGVAFNIKSISYDNRRNILYVMGSVDGSVVNSYHVPPRSAAQAPVFGAIVSFPQTFTSVGCTKNSMTIDDATGCLYFAITPSAGNSQIVQTLPFGSTTAIATNTPQAVVSEYYLCQVPSGYIAAYQVLNKRFYTSRSMGTFSAGTISSNTYVALCKTPYGIIA